MVRTLALSTNDHALLDSLPRLPDDLAELDQLGRVADAPARLRLADAVMVTLRVHGRFAEASEQGERLTRLAEAAVVAQSAEVSDRLPGLLLQVGISHLHAAEFSLAHRALRRAYELAPHGSSTHIARDSAGKLALVLTAQGHTERAAQWLDRHDSAPRQDGWLGDQVDTTGLVVRAWAALDRLDLTAAARLLAAIQSDLIGGYALSAMIAYVEALYRLHTNRVEEALHELSRLITTNRALREPGSLPMVLTESLRADLLLALGRGNHARAALTAENLLHPLARVPLARLSLLSGDEAGAIAIANDFGSLHTAPPRLTVAMLVIKAIAHHRMRQPATATATLGNAISAARANHLRRPFATVARDELLEIAEGLRPDAREFLDHPALRAVESPYPAQLDLVHLTERERLILIRLATGERVHEVAAHLFLSYNTVRTYLRQIYKKLAANSREQAVARARAYGLISS
jgi:LuxR family maltose regulon positive regulatory protein